MKTDDHHLRSLLQGRFRVISLQSDLWRVILGGIARREDRVGECVIPVPTLLCEHLGNAQPSKAHQSQLKLNGRSHQICCLSLARSNVPTRCSAGGSKAIIFPLGCQGDKTSLILADHLYVITQNGWNRRGTLWNLGTVLQMSTIPVMASDVTSGRVLPFPEGFRELTPSQVGGVPRPCADCCSRVCLRGHKRLRWKHIAGTSY